MASFSQHGLATAHRIGLSLRRMCAPAIGNNKTKLFGPKECSSFCTTAISSDETPLVNFTVDPKTNVATITLRSPRNSNALTVEMGREFESVISRLCRSEDLNAVILTGEGNAFSAGGDLKWLKSLSRHSVHRNTDLMYNFYRSFLSIRTLPVPTIAAIHGPAIGAGACLALACDLRVMSSPHGKLGFTFASLGIHAGMGGTHLLPLHIGTQKANEALLTGKVFDANESLQCGLVCRISTDCCRKQAEDLAEEIGKKNPLAIRGMVRSIRLRENSGLEECLRREAMEQAMCYARKDWGEGLDALIEKREPAFSGYHE